MFHPPANAPHAAVAYRKKTPPPPRRAPHCGAWYETPRPRHGGVAADETCGRAAPRHAVNNNKKKHANPRCAAAGACVHICFKLYL
jgi:hypothetical protein